jgi:hypothetical protein
MYVGCSVWEKIINNKQEFYVFLQKWIKNRHFISHKSNLRQNKRVHFSVFHMIRCILDLNPLWPLKGKNNAIKID